MGVLRIGISRTLRRHSRPRQCVIESYQLQPTTPAISNVRRAQDTALNGAPASSLVNQCLALGVQRDTLRHGIDMHQYWWIPELFLSPFFLYTKPSLPDNAVDVSWAIYRWTFAESIRVSSRDRS